MKKLMMILVAIGLLAGMNVFAGEGEKAKGTEQELKGKLVKQEKKSKGGKVKTRYMLKCEDKSSVALPAPKKSKDGDEAVIELDEFVDKDVTIKALTVEKESKKGKKFTRVMQIIEIKPTATE